MLRKKNILAELYKNEAGFEKINKLLSNNFDEPKWQKTAEKNAMVLIGRRNFNFSTALFLLANNLQNAL
jgi:hypothetical protein